MIVVRQNSRKFLSESLVPEIVAEFRDTVVISDEAESTVDVTPPTTDAGPLPSTSAALPTPHHVRQSTSSISVDVTAKKPTRPSKLHISVRKLRTTVLKLQEIPRPPPEAIQQARRRLKTVTSLHMANATIYYHKSTEELAEEFACSYSLKPQECYNVRREMRKMRLAQKALIMRICSKFPTNCRSEAQCQQFLDWFEAESCLVANRHSDSDDSTPELGIDQP